MFKWNNESNTHILRIKNIEIKFADLTLTISHEISGSIPLDIWTHTFEQIEESITKEVNYILDNNNISYHMKLHVHSRDIDNQIIIYSAWMGPKNKSPSDNWWI